MAIFPFRRYGTETKESITLGFPQKKRCVLRRTPSVLQNEARVIHSGADTKIMRDQLAKRPVLAMNLNFDPIAMGQ
jgi:hypothetical protein